MAELEHIQKKQEEESKMADIPLPSERSPKSPKGINLSLIADLDGSVGCTSNWLSDSGFHPSRVQQHSFMEIDHEMFSIVILSLLLIQEGPLSVFRKSMCTSTGYRLED